MFPGVLPQLPALNHELVRLSGLSLTVLCVSD